MKPRQDYPRRVYLTGNVDRIEHNGKLYWFDTATGEILKPVMTLEDYEAEECELLLKVPLIL